MKRWVNTGKKWLAVLFLVFLLVIWEMLARFYEVPVYILPMPSVIAEALFASRNLLLFHTQATMTAALSGLALAVVLAVVIAYLMNSVKVVKDMLYPLLVISQTIPIIAIAPVMIIWFGFGYLPKILTVVLVCFFPMTVNITEGLRNVDRENTELLQTLGAGSLQIFRHNQLPSVLPFFFSGLRISVTYSVMASVIGEWLGGNKGLGVFMIRSMHTYNTAALFAAIVVVVMISMLLFIVTNSIARQVMPWEKVEGEIVQ